MKIVPKNPKSFHNVLNVIKSVNPEFYVIPKKNSVVFWTIDPPRTMIYSAVLPKTAMLVYEVDKNELDKMKAYDVKYFNKALRKVKPDTQLTIEQTGEGYTLIRVEKPFKINARIPQYSTDIEEITLPELELPAWLTGYGAIWLEIVETAKQFSDVVTIVAEKDGVKFVAEGDTSEVMAELDIEHEWVSEYEVDEDAELPIKANYDLKRLSAVLKGITKSTVVEAGLGTEMPLYLTWEDTDGFKHNYLLAPRVDNE